jgi:sortase A
MGDKNNLSRKLERLLIIVGAVLLTSFIMMRIYAAAGSLFGCMSFETAHSAAPSRRIQVKNSDPVVVGGIDFGLWSAERIRAFQQSLAKHFKPPLALLNIPRIHLEVPVFNGTDEGVLNRGVGRIIGTAQVGSNGNVGIAGHRDGFFRRLKDLIKGDSVELIAVERTLFYQVDNIAIVSPDDIHVLADRGVPTITLVTCYPFYFVGDAPQRYVLQCSLKRSNLHNRGSQAGKTGQTSTSFTKGKAGDEKQTK